MRKDKNELVPKMICAGLRDWYDVKIPHETPGSVVNLENMIFFLENQ